MAVGAALRLLVTGSAGGVVAVWSLQDKHLLQVLQVPSGGSENSFDISYSSDQTVTATSCLSCPDSGHLVGKDHRKLRPLPLIGCRRLPEEVELKERPAAVLHPGGGACWLHPFSGSPAGVGAAAVCPHLDAGR